jgi:hypothetical protein
MIVARPSKMAVSLVLIKKVGKICNFSRVFFAESKTWRPHVHN